MLGKSFPRENFCRACLWLGEANRELFYQNHPWGLLSWDTKTQNENESVLVTFSGAEGSGAGGVQTAKASRKQSSLSGKNRRFHTQLDKWPVTP